MNFQKATAVILSALIACFLSGCDMPIEFAVSSESQSNSAPSNGNSDSSAIISEPSTTVVPNANISDSDISESEDSALSNSVPLFNFPGCFAEKFKGGICYEASDY